MPDDINFKIEQILSELPEDKRKILKDHIDELEGKEKEDFLIEVITEYESVKNRSLVSSAETATESDNKEINIVKEDDVIESGIEDVFEQGDESADKPGVRPVNITFDPFHDMSAIVESPKAELPAPDDAPSSKSAEPVNEKQKKKPIAAIIICSAIGLIAIASALYFLVLPKNPSFQAFTSRLGITPVVTETENTDASETETSVLPTPTPEPTATPTPTPIPTPTATPTPTPIPLKENAPDLKGIKVVIDPGHQEKTDYKKEQFKKGTSNGKPRSTSGAVGIVTGQKEYELTLDTALMLKEYLEKCGATVVLTRTENNVNISNKERAALAVKAKPTLFIRLHADASTNASVKGVRVYIPSSGKLNIAADANKLGKLVASAGKTTFRGSKATNQYTGLNFAASVRSYQIVLGYLSNKEDDERLADVENRYEMCAAIATFCKSFKKK